MAENGINGHQSNKVEWRVGFTNSDGKYLTAETFGYKVNANGTALKKKQIWCLEQDPVQNCVYIRSGLGRYMSSDKQGNITVNVEAADRGEDEKFEVEYNKDGKWAFKHIKEGLYLTGIGEEVKCSGKTKTVIDWWWSIQLYVHPQINLRNVNRGRCVHLNTDTNELECTELVPWGSDALVFLDFVEGQYTIRTCDNRYLNRDGTLQDNCDDDTKFYMEIHSGCLAFKDCEGRYLAGVGKGTLKTRNKVISKDELFTIEDSHPQCQIIACKSGKSVSVKQGVDVSANQPTDEIEDTEIFQMEYNKALGTWAFLASAKQEKKTSKYWELKAGTVQILNAETTSNSFFEIDWQDDGTVFIKGSDGKYLSNRPTGVLYSTEEKNKFIIVIVNRPLLVLKSEFGFVGAGPKGSQVLCSRAKYDTLKVTADGKGNYTIQGLDGKYWSVGNDSMVYPDDSATKFQFQFCGGSMLAIRAPNGCFLKGEQNGNIKASATEIDASSMWEF